METRSLKTSVAALAVLGVSAAAGVAYAAIPAADGVIHSCYATTANSSGQLRVIDAEAGIRCGKNERALDFNQQGAKGDTGAQGIQGEPGPSGDEVWFNSGVGPVRPRSPLDPRDPGIRFTLSLDVPEGAYRLDARVDASGSYSIPGKTVLLCSIPGPGPRSAVVSLPDHVDELLWVGQKDLTSVVSGPETVSLECSGAATPGYGGTWDVSATLIATKVLSIHTGDG